jgi:hypothetical protein
MQDKSAKRKKQRAYRQKAKAYVIDVKSTNHCKDCGVHHPFYVLQFDHVRGVKEFDLWRAGDSVCSLKRIQDEIDKCDIVCANCHSVRTYKRNLKNNDELQTDSF